MKIREMEKLLAEMVDIQDVYQGYKFYTFNLLEKCTKIFEYTGLPDTMPEHVIEKLFITVGMCGAVEEKGKIYAVQGGEHGVTPYPDIYTKFRYSAPTLNGGEKTQGVNCVVGRNNTLKMSLMPIIWRYARQLADIDCTITMVMVNMRIPYITIAPNDSVKASIDKVMRSVELGKKESVSHDEVVTHITSIPNTVTGQQTLKDLNDLKNNVLKGFYNAIGVKLSTDKKERLISDEVNSANQFLMVNLSDMLKWRMEFVEGLNKVFGLNVSVKLSKEYDIETVEDKDVDTVGEQETESTVALTQPKESEDTSK